MQSMIHSSRKAGLFPELQIARLTPDCLDNFDREDGNT